MDSWMDKKRFFKEFKKLFLPKKGHFGTKKRGFAAVLEHGFLSRKNKQTRYSTAFHAILVVYKKSKSRLFRDVSFSILGRFVFAIIIGTGIRSPDKLHLLL